ncbi:GFA family protein [Devosia sp. YIM 151766]|uniref:GFA family protein n=1 Tax=Devosia sp. YIM 151766 TaxID=3017325 RepID=UPI00255C58C3|nr:GFA family protein [Devosia sp. YIM 151766]WIY51625.1 GFA family protein [Devosia sp. YIM 151766]
MPEIELTATCDCGAVTLAVQGPVVSMFQCGCQNCQKVSGSGHSSVFLMESDNVRPTGATKSFARPTDSGAVFTRNFCPECGTTIYAESSRAPAFRLVPIGLFAGRNDWFAPNQLIFARSHPAWDLIEAQLPRYQTYRPEQR